MEHATAVACSVLFLFYWLGEFLCPAWAGLVSLK